MTSRQQLQNTQVFLLSPSHLDAQAQRPGRLLDRRQTSLLAVVAIRERLICLQDTEEYRELSANVTRDLE
jgi:hypothetical protein